MVKDHTVKLQRKGVRPVSKPTMQDIADALSTSRITVWKALNNRPGVSETLRQQILQTAREMGYAKGGTPAAAAAQPAVPATARTVAVVVSRPESSLFWMQIVHRLARELTAQGWNLMYTYLPAYGDEDYSLPAALTDGSVAGIIVLNIYCQPLLQLLADLPLPKVFLDSVPGFGQPELGGDLLLLEGRRSIRQITGRLLDLGYQRLSFIGDVDYAQTNTDRYKGFLDAHRDRGLTPDDSLSLTGPLGLYTHYEEICNFLDALPSLPDAYVCASDYIAHYIQRYYDERGLPRDGKIPLTGFDNNAEYANVADRITTVDVQTPTIGARLAARILFRLANPDAASEVSYIYTRVIYRGLEKE